MLSLHEPDADAIAALVLVPDFTPCAFACLDLPEQTAGKTTLRCVAP